LLVTETSASRSSVGSWHRRLTASHPHMSLSFRCNSGFVIDRRQPNTIKRLWTCGIGRVV
jgi:hypothetical protein